MSREIYKYMRVNDFEAFIDRDEVVLDALDKTNITLSLTKHEKEREREVEQTREAKRRVLWG